MKKLLAHLAVMLVPALVFAAGPRYFPVADHIEQGGTLCNAVTTGSANAEASQVVAAVAGTNVHLHDVEANCAPGTAAPAQLLVLSGGTTIFQTLAAEVGTSTGTVATHYRKSWTGVPLTGAAGEAMTIKLTSCGSASSGTLVTQCSQW